MNVFFDTSSLFKLYHNETGTSELMRLFNDERIEVIYLSTITKIEFCSVVWKKCRKAEIDEITANQLIQKFDKDSEKFNYVPDSLTLKKNALKLISNHWRKGLRTLDSLQLASALKVKGNIHLFLTDDRILAEISRSEGLVVK